MGDVEAWNIMRPSHSIPTPCFNLMAIPLYTLSAMVHVTYGNTKYQPSGSTSFVFWTDQNETHFEKSKSVRDSDMRLSCDCTIIGLGPFELPRWSGI